MLGVEYIAGFVDADGCISSHVTPSGTKQWEVNIVQSVKNDKGVLTQVQKQYGGSLCVSKRGGSCSDIRRWKVQGVEAAIVLSDIYPFLHVKKERAFNALSDFAEHPKISKVLDRIGEPRWLYGKEQY